MLILKKGHPAREKLGEQAEIITPETAKKADIRALRLGVLNLMPLMNEAENDILQSISHSILQIEPVWIKIASREKSGKNTSLSHIKEFYQTMEEATKNENLDGLIVTGAPIELIDFSEVEYWEEIKRILDYAKENIYSTMFLCWGAMAGLFYYYGINKIIYSKKLSGVFQMKNLTKDSHPMTIGMNTHVNICQSRYTDINQEKVEELVKNGKIIKLFESDEMPLALNGGKIGATVLSSKDNSSIFNLGHFEYHEKTIDADVKRDLLKNPRMKYPVENYYKNPGKLDEIHEISWKSDRTLFYSNFLNLVYHKMNEVKKPHVRFIM